MKGKAGKLFLVIDQKEAIPEESRKGYPINFEEETLLKAPWVNLVHGWSKVLNYMNSISAIQKGEMEFDPQVIASIARGLYLLTTKSDPNPFLRTDERFLEGDFAETKMRESGTKGVNPSRHVSFQEMKYILSVIKGKFAKEEAL